MVVSGTGRSLAYSTSSIPTILNSRGILYGIAIGAVPVVVVNVVVAGAALYSSFRRGRPESAGEASLANQDRVEEKEPVLDHHHAEYLAKA